MQIELSKNLDCIEDYRYAAKMCEATMQHVTRKKAMHVAVFRSEACKSQTEHKS